MRTSKKCYGRESRSASRCARRGPIPRLCKIDHPIFGYVIGDVVYMFAQVCTFLCKKKVGDERAGNENTVRRVRRGKRCSYPTTCASWVVLTWVVLERWRGFTMYQLTSPKWPTRLCLANRINSQRVCQFFALRPSQLRRGWAGPFACQSDLHLI